MGLDERFTYLLLGIAIGAVAGYIVGTLRSIDLKVTEVDKLVKQDHDEKGIIRFPSVADMKYGLRRFWLWLKSIRLKNWALLLVVAMSAIASFQSQSVSNEIQKNAAEDQRQQTAIENISKCNSDFLGDVILALNERTEYTVDQANANVGLQREQLRLLTFALSIPPPSAAEGRKSFERYVDKLNRFIDLARKTAAKTATYQYPTLDAFADCVNKEAS